MQLAIKEMKKNKMRFLILGSIIFLVSFLTLSISGLANGLSQDNASLIKDLPDGHFYLNADAEETYNLSKIDPPTQKDVLKNHADATALSIQMGFLHNAEDKQLSAAFLTASDSPLFPHVRQGEVILDNSFKEKGVKIGDQLTNEQLNRSLTVKGFVEKKKFSHSPVAFVNTQDYTQMYGQKDMQMLFIPGDTMIANKDLQTFSNKDFLKAIPSYSAEQLSLTMIIWFLILISGLLFAIFFYMMNVQKIGLYGILKAIGIKMTSLFAMIWTQMFVITATALTLSALGSQLFSLLAPDGMPYHLPINVMTQLSIVFFIVGFIGATLSGLQIKKIDPLQAIQKGDM